MVCPKPLLTEFGIHHRLVSCDILGLTKVPPRNKDTASFSLCQIKEMAIVNIPGLLQQKLSPKQPHLRQLPQQLRAAASSKSHYSLTAIAACGERIKRLSAPTPSLPPSGEMI